MSLTVVLPIKKNQDGRFIPNQINSIDRLVDVTLPSYVKFFNTMSQFIIIVTDDEYNEVVERTAIFPLPISIMLEDEICPTLTRWHGWWKQQIIKLAMANIVTTPFYLCTDDDVLVIRPTTEKDLIINGKPIFTKVPPNSWHQSWYQDSKTVLKYSRDIKFNDTFMGVSPEILITSIVKSLQGRLTNIYGEWQLALKRLTDKLTWTEYTLYWTHVTYKYDMEDLYDFSKSISDNYIRPGNYIERLNSEFIKKVFDPNNRHHFTPISSKIPAEYNNKVPDMIKPYLL